MRLILQRVSRCQVTVDSEVVGSIGSGLLVLVGVEKGDGPRQVTKAVQKLASLRIFEDAAGRMNLDISAAEGDFLLVSQFTLAGSLAKGRRPSFDKAEHPGLAKPLFDSLVEALRGEGFRVETGRFGAKMEVELVNDGPVTFVLEV